jgi:NIPSNAP
MLYELRIYHAAPGRLPDLNKRFETITLKIWERFNIRAVGFWTVVIGESNQDLYYLLEWKDLAERERLMSAFAADPEWLKARAETEKNGPLITHLSNAILTPTAYSKMR